MFGSFRPEGMDGYGRVTGAREKVRMVERGLSVQIYMNLRAD